MTECICSHEWDDHEVAGGNCTQTDCFCETFEMVGEEVPAI